MPQLPPPETTVEVHFGFMGEWVAPTVVSKDVTEEELNDIATSVLRRGVRVATPDFIGRPYQNQEFRCYPDLSGDIKVWITLRQSAPRKSLITRVSPQTPKVDIEREASAAWVSPTIFQSKFPAVLDPNEIYWMQPRPAEKEGEQPSPVETEPQPLGLQATEFKETPLISGIHRR
jgi:hypothetical protein